jgi:hypothetical protein
VYSTLCVIHDWIDLRGVEVSWFVVSGELSEFRWDSPEKRPIAPWVAAVSLAVLTAVLAIVLSPKASRQEPRGAPATKAAKAPPVKGSRGN